MTDKLLILLTITAGFLGPAGARAAESPKLVQMDFNDADGVASLVNRGSADFEGYFFQGSEFYAPSSEDIGIDFSDDHAPSNSGGYSIYSAKLEGNETCEVLLGAARTEVLEALNPPGGLKVMTITAWIKVDEDTAGKHLILSNNEGNSGWEFYYDATENRLATRFGGSDFKSEPEVLTKGEWTFVGFVFDSTKVPAERLAFFTGDGKSIAERGWQATHGTELSNNTQASAIARDAGPWASDSQFKGYIDNLMISNLNETDHLTEIMTYDDAAAAER